MPGGNRRAVPGSGPVDEQLFGLAHRAQLCRGITRSCRGKTAGKPRCAPMPARCCAPIPNNCSRSRCFSVPIPMSRWYNNPNNSSAFPRSRCWRSRCPDYPEHFPMINARLPPQSKPATRLDFRYPLLLGFVRLLWEFLLV